MAVVFSSDEISLGFYSGQHLGQQNEQSKADWPGRNDQSVRRLLRELSQRNSPYNLQVGAAELGGVIQKYGGNYILAFAGYPAERYQKATMSIRPRLRAT